MDGLLVVPRCSDVVRACAVTGGGLLPQFAAREIHGDDTAIRLVMATLILSVIVEKSAASIDERRLVGRVHWGRAGRRAVRPNEETTP
jgi:hypothetical protein